VRQSASLRFVLQPLAKVTVASLLNSSSSGGIWLNIRGQFETLSLTGSYEIQT
jgi:hypothetical protein